MSLIIKHTEQFELSRQIASIKLNFFDLAANNVCRMLLFIIQAHYEQKYVEGLTIIITKTLLMVCKAMVIDESLQNDLCSGFLKYFKI